MVFSIGLYEVTLKESREGVLQHQLEYFRLRNRVCIDIRGADEVQHTFSLRGRYIDYGEVDAAMKIVGDRCNTEIRVNTKRRSELEESHMHTQ